MAVLGTLHNNYHGDALTTTDEAWMGEIDILQQVLIPWKDENAQVIFEYEIPRLGKRIDVVLLLRGIIFCLEFKVGKKEALQADVEQVMDYALDLKNFHRFSHDRIIVPILIPTNYASSTTVFQPSVYDDQIYNPLISGAEQLQRLIIDVLNHSKAIDVGLIDKWIISPYTPTPTIIEAARALYENHSVEDITRHEADKVSTDRTINFILDVIEQSKANKKKSICFVTGVPGAGKTLVGLDVAIKQTYKNGELDKENGAVYLSGNGPLVAVLTEALARDNQKKCSAKGEKKNLSDSRREVSEFIQIIHRYRDNMLAKIKNPVENGIVEIDPEKAIHLEHTGFGEVEHVAIFDEAQRAWTKEELQRFMREKKGIRDFPYSEPEYLISCMDRQIDWGLVVCLVGNGQAINKGEAGLKEWIESVHRSYPNWDVYMSDYLIESKDITNEELALIKKKLISKENLHLKMSMRSFRSEKVSIFVNQLLALQKEEASATLKELGRYPIVLTRNLDVAKEWLRKHTRGSERMGLLASSKAERLKAIGINVRYQPNFVHWFLEDDTDIRSSNCLEDTLTEFKVQGLEIDWACVTWDADLRLDKNRSSWQHYQLRSGTKWQNINKDINKEYQINAYRVLLTRARQGMVIVVPNGDNGVPPDETRKPEWYDGIYEYLKSLGVEEI